MIVYSKKIVRFLNEIKMMVKNILSREIGLIVTGNRFFDRPRKTSYPISIVIFNNKSMLGYFNSNFFELGFHECLMYSNKEQLHNLIRHEVAHYMTCIECGEVIQPHGPEFRAFCLKQGWGEEIYKASVCLEGGQNISDLEESSISRKIKKLMALATSSNPNEAEQAMIKSQQLLLKHNIESKYIEGDDEEKIVLKRIMQQKREDAKMRSIAKILETFFVNVVYSRFGGFIYLEILGSEVNIEIAEYVASFLQDELERLWKQAQAYAKLSGKIAKNSFFMGLAKGYCNKIQALKREYTSETANALMVIEKKLIDAKAMVYQRLSSSKRSSGYCLESSSLGEIMGRKLNINPAINSTSQSMLLIS